MPDLMPQDRSVRATASQGVSAPAARAHKLLLEGCWLLIVVALATAVVSTTAHTSGRGEMMFLDGDSMVVPLFARSLISAQESDWGMSAVLFVPELFLYLLVSILPLGVAQMQLVAATLNLVCLYLALRLAAHWVMTSSQRRVIAAVGAYATYCLLILLEGAGDRNSLELASLLTLTTYYSGTVLAAIVTVAAAQRAIAAPTLPPVPTTTLIAVSAISSFSNPLFVAWAALPLIIVVLILPRATAWRRRAWVSACLALSAILGYCGRLPLEHWIIANGDNYFRSGHLAQSLAYYTDLFEARVASPQGIASCAVVIGLVGTALALSLRTWRERRAEGALVAGYAWFAPLAVTGGLLLLGTEAARYLQVWIFAPIMMILVLVDRLPARRTIWQASASRRILLLLIPCVLATGVTVGATVSAARAAQATDESLSCVVDWVDHSDRTGAGQFWSVRAVKAHIAEPARLVQVDYQMNGYGWLVDRNDFQAEAVSFLITDSQTYPFQLAEPYASAPYTNVDCGRFSIHDYGKLEIPIGPVWPQ